MKVEFEEAVERVKEALAGEGFGVLTEIDIRKALKAKLGVDYPDYRILGACNPPFAKRALDADREIGLYLPCNVIVYQDGDVVQVHAAPPTKILPQDKKELEGIAREVEEKLARVINSL